MMLHSSHLGDRPLLLWSMALGMLAIAFLISLTGLDANDEFSTVFFRMPFIAGLLLATFVMGFVRPEMRKTWTVGMGGIPSVVLLAATEIRILFTPEHNPGSLWLLVVVLALVLGLSLAFSGSSLGAKAALRLSRY
jgi:peptidoglycan/LPS O-acetylase OafA/YrhL